MQKKDSFIPTNQLEPKDSDKINYSRVIKESIINDYSFKGNDLKCLNNRNYRKTLYIRKFRYYKWFNQKKLV